MPPTTSTALSPTDTFAERHLGPGGAEQAKMLSELGFATLDDLAAAAVPAAIRSLQPLDLPEALGESATTAELRRYASENRVVPSLIGLGYHGTLTPPVIQRNVLEDPSWYTAYTPYQPEISQGRLEALLNFQTMVSDLTGMELANASLLDEPTAAAEAMAMARRLAPSSASDRFVVDAGCHPHTIAVVQTRAEPLGIVVEVGDAAALIGGGAAPFGVLVQNPSTTGEIRDLRALASHAQDVGALMVVATDLLACCLITPPGEQGADIVVGSAQRFGVPLGFGGPHAGFIATKAANARLAARSPRRCVERRRRTRRAAARAADAGTAHQAGEGDEQHLHRAGAARGRRVDVRRVPRSRRAEAHRRPGPRAHVHTRPGIRRPRCRARASRVLRHDHGAGGRARRRPGAGRARERREHSPRRRRSSRDRGRRDDDGGSPSRGRVGVRSRSRLGGGCADVDPRRPSSHLAVHDAPGVPRASLRDVDAPVSPIPRAIATSPSTDR